MILGLRIDVDTLKGTREGVPRILRSLDRHGIRAVHYKRDSEVLAFKAALKRGVGKDW